MSIYFSTGNRSVRRVMDAGRTLILDDNSRWSIPILDRIKTLMWLPGDQVIVTPLGSIYRLERKSLNGRSEVVEAIPQR